MKINLPNVLLCALFLKAIVFGATWPECGMLIAITAMACYFHFLDFIKVPEINQEFKKELAALRDSVKETRDKVEAIKLSNTFKR